MRKSVSLKRCALIFATLLFFFALPSLTQVAAQTQGVAAPPAPVVTGYPMHVPANPNLPTFFLIGDSTVRNG